MAKVLIVDGELDRGAALAAALGLAGVHPTVVMSTRAALPSLEASAVDAILLAVTTVDPVAARLADLRGHPVGAVTPVIAVADHDQPGALAAAVATGYDDVLVRPLRPAEVGARLRLQVSARRKLAEAMEIAARVRAECEEVRAARKLDAALTEYLIHDLRSPIAAVAMYLQELLATPETAPVAHTLQACLAATDTIGRMVMNHLDVAAGGPRPVAAVACDLAAALAAAAAHFAPRCDARGVTLVRRLAAPQVWADPELLRRIIENLLDNALRYAPAGTAIEVESTSAGPRTVLAVTDRGPGVPAADRARVFEHAVQLDPPPGCRGGRGLGLAFCKMATEAHGGGIQIDDAAGGGARIEAWFPVCEAPLW
ncbi:MAG: ATP-binding protein [Kofleriaceae bacterium]